MAKCLGGRRGAVGAAMSERPPASGEAVAKRPREAEYIRAPLPAELSLPEAARGERLSQQVLSGPAVACNSDTVHNTRLPPRTTQMQCSPARDSPRQAGYINAAE